MYIVSLFVVPIAKGVTIDVWIQEEIIAGGLVFNDGSPFTTDFDTFFPVDLGHDPTETRVQARGSSTFEILGRGEDVPSSYLCEYFHLFTL